jgi:protein tyrosine/serine phosphatase
MSKSSVEKSLFLISLGFLCLLVQGQVLEPAQAESQAEAALKRTEVTRTVPPDTQAVKKIEDLPNFHQVHPFLYRGGEPTLKGIEQLQSMGVKTIIDLRAPSEMKFAEPEAAKKMGFTYINLVMSSKAPTDKQVKIFMEKVDHAKAKYDKGEQVGDKPEAVFVHCAHGSDRTGSMVGIWRVSRDNFDYNQAYREMRKYYFGPKFVELSGAVRNAWQKCSKPNVISNPGK